MKTPRDLTDDELIAQLRRVTRELPDAPAALQKAALDLWHTSPLAAKAAAPTTAGVAPSLMHATAAAVKRFAASLTFDSWATPALAGGMRSGRSATRQLLFSTVGRDIDLRIVPAAEGFGIAGQVLGPDEAGEVALSLQGEDGGEPRRAQLDKLGAFRIDNVPKGIFVMTLNLGETFVVLPPLEVGECTP